MSKPPLRLNDSITLSRWHWNALLKLQSGSFHLTHLVWILVHQSLSASRSHSYYWKPIYTVLDLFLLMLLSSCRLRFSRRAMSSLEDLREQWNHLYRTQLPALAKAKDAAQPKWPVQLDHCFARIILDNAVGKDRPWNQVLKSPAYKHMSREQLNTAIALGEKLSNGEEDLVALDERSLSLRGKKSKTKAEPAAAHQKRKIDPDDEGTQPPKKQAPGRKVTSYFQPAARAKSEKVKHKSHERNTAVDSSSEIVGLINSSSELTPFRKSILALLTQVPRGRYTTYQALADHISSTSHKSSARAVGSAMRNNPFAPVVPCHRVLASDATIGGFGGEWGEDGQHASEKRSLLREEGVKFDGKGKAVGEPFCGFQ